MKLLIASDIHGSALYCRKLIERYKAEGADHMLLLGDILYHGPRNRLPDEYDPPAVAEMLNAMSDEIMCVRGNCDSEVDQMVLDFPIMADYAVLDLVGRVVFATHGHKFDENSPMPMKTGDVMLSGHTHVPKCVEKDGRTFMNPGSVSIPKGGSERSYMIFDDGVFLWKALDGRTYTEHSCR